MYIPGQSGGHEGELRQFEQLGPIMDLPQETVDQVGSLAEEALLQGGEPLVAQRPQWPLLIKERVVAEQDAQGCVLGHRFRSQKTDLDKNKKKILPLLSREPVSVAPVILGWKTPRKSEDLFGGRQASLLYIPRLS